MINFYYVSSFYSVTMLYKSPSLEFSQYLRSDLRVKMVNAVLKEEFDRLVEEDLLSCRGQGRAFMKDRADKMNDRLRKKRRRWLKK